MFSTRRRQPQPSSCACEARGGCFSRARIEWVVLTVDERKVVPRMSQEGLEATFEEDGRPPVLVAHLTVTVTEILGARNLGGRGGGVGRSAAARPLLADEMDEKKKRVPMTPV